MRVLWEDAATEDVGEAATYIELDRPAKGEELVIAIMAVVERKFRRSAGGKIEGFGLKIFP